MFKFLKNLLTPTKLNLNATRVRFHHDTAGAIPHGQIVMTSAAYGVRRAPVTFYFAGLDDAPPLTPEVMELIWESALNKGWLPHEITSYGVTATKAALDLPSAVFPFDAANPAINPLGEIAGLNYKLDIMTPDSGPIRLGAVVGASAL